ncbi:MAG TPA: amidase, partial [Oligoflexia bacterium]|nr:amidase [Oligoflexia bacterium]
MILQLHEKLKTKKISAVELTQHYLKRVKTDSNNVYITVCDREAVAAAEKADQALAQGKAGLLTGIPVGIKDIFCTAGVKTTCASKILGDYVPPYDATCVARLKRNGAVLLGKLNMDEFAMGGSNENSAFGPVKNPIDPRYVPGGSSGGSAAAVAGGLAVAALGTDTGGSIRLPASYTGTVGLKPTYGRVSRNGLVAFGSSLDQAGPMTTTVSDAAIVLESISGHDPFDSTSSVLPSENFLASMVTESSR